ncbi:MAG: YraN family protein [Syntrophobacteraceae bacterium]
MTTKSRYDKGKEGETVAADYLCECGLKILDRNFRCPLGEIDLIAKDGRTIVFVEVRSRKADDFRSPEESLAAPKFRRITKAALWYLKRQGTADSFMRFDVVAISWTGEKPQISWIVNAFQPR